MIIKNIKNKLLLLILHHELIQSLHQYNQSLDDIMDNWDPELLNFLCIA